MLRSYFLLFISLSFSFSTFAKQIPRDFAAPSTTAGPNMKGAENKDAKKEQWSYEGQGRPANWANINPAYSKCQNGKEQSPVALTRNAIKNDDNDIIIDYGNTYAQLSKQERTLTYFVKEREHGVTLLGKDYRLIQFHFHAKSEHTLDGLYAPLELHFVHKSRDDQFLVVGVFIKPGPVHETLQHLLVNNYPQKRSGIDISLDSLLPVPGDRKFFYYMGSFSTPPCQEGVHWIMMEHSIKASEQQIEALSRLIPKTARPLQKLYGRKFIQIGNK